MHDVFIVAALLISCVSMSVGAVTLILTFRVQRGPTGERGPQGLTGPKGEKGDSPSAVDVAREMQNLLAQAAAREQVERA